MRNVSDPAVFTRNFQVRLDDAVHLEKVTHRANKPWRSAQIGIDRYGELPIYVKSRDEERNVVTHVGTLEDVVVYPSENPEKAEQLREYVADRDTWNEHFDGADTLYLINSCQELADPFCFTELRKIVNGEPLPSSCHCLVQGV